MERLRTEIRLVLVVALGVALAATARASVWSPLREGVADVDAVLVVLALSGGIAAGVVLLLRASRRSARPARAGLAAVAMAVAALSGLWGIERIELHDPLPAAAAEEGEGPTRLGRPLLSDWRGPAQRNLDGEEEVDLPRASATGSYRVLQLGAIIGIVALLALLAGRRPARSASVETGAFDPPPDERAKARVVVVATIEEMIADRDPRTAIIGAYRRLLDALTTSGAGRHMYEGPAEHLARVLGTLQVRREALESLVQLFAIARFSEHELSQGHRDQALAALTDVAEDLSRPRVPSDSSGVKP